jgi:hypothetical protein
MEITAKKKVYDLKNESDSLVLNGELAVTGETKEFNGYVTNKDGAKSCSVYYRMTPDGNVTISISGCQCVTEAAHGLISSSITEAVAQLPEQAEGAADNPELPEDVNVEEGA